MGNMMFTINLVNNLLILLVSNFHRNRIYGLRVIVVGSWSPEMLPLCNFWTDLENYFFDLDSQ